MGRYEEEEEDRRIAAALRRWADEETHKPQHVRDHYRQLADHVAPAPPSAPATPAVKPPPVSRKREPKEVDGDTRNRGLRRSA